MNQKLQVIGAMLLTASMLGGCAASKNKSSTSVSVPETMLSTSVSDTEVASKPSLEADHLTNRMSERERNSVKVGPLTILDKPWGNKIPDPYQEGVVLEIADSEDWIAYYERSLRLPYLQDDAQRREFNEEALESNRAYPFSAQIQSAYVNGKQVGVTPYTTDYDGGAFEFYQSFLKKGGGDDYLKVHQSFENYEAFKIWLAEFLEEEKDNIDRSQFDYEYDDIIAVWDAVINGQYTVAPLFFMSSRDMYNQLGQDGDKAWEYVPEEMAAIQDSVSEIHVTDDEMGIDFLSHVILPPNYDETKTYPVLFLTDAVWRFGSCPALWQAMADGRAQPMIMVTLGYDYRYNGANENLRGQLFLMEPTFVDDFITDNLMPLISEMYKIDCDTSTFFGHSDAGVLSFYCLFNSDLYENQPFGKYIIGSPALWGYEEGMGRGMVENFCGYWERNQTLNKSVFITAGELEDPDYASYYEGRPTTIEGAKTVHDSIISHGGDSELKLYEGSHHYQYIPDMLLEYISI